MKQARHNKVAKQRGADGRGADALWICHLPQSVHFPAFLYGQVLFALSLEFTAKADTSLHEVGTEGRWGIPNMTGSNKGRVGAKLGPGLCVPLGSTLRT